MPEFHISVLGSGSSGNVTFLSDGSVNILIDAGLSCREIERRLRTIGFESKNIDAVLLSHEHSDHTKGAWRFCAKHSAKIFATLGTHEGISKISDKNVEWVRVYANSSMKIGKLLVDFFSTPHDAADPVGFRIRRGKLAFGHVTDLGHISENVVNGLRGCSSILIEANHDIDMLRNSSYPESIRKRIGGRWGHLSNDAVAHYLEYRLPDGVRHLFLAHLSQQNNHESLVLDSCLEALARRGGSSPKLHLTHNRQPTPLLRLTAPTHKTTNNKQGSLVFS